MAFKEFFCVHCHGRGHSSRDCHHKLTARAPPRLITIPSNTSSTIRHLSAYAIFYLESGRPSVQELREMLAYRFNFRTWPHQIKQAAGNSFMVQFPSDPILAQAVQLGLIDMGTFKGRFRRWEEDLRLVTLPQSFPVWIRLFNVPYHLWNFEFLRSLLMGVGECVMCSRDVITHSNFADCRVLLKVRNLSEIPKRLRFRYISPGDGNIKEGYAVTQVQSGEKLELLQESTPELIEVVWDGRNMTVERDQWQLFLRNQGVGGSNYPRALPIPNDNRPLDINGSDSSSTAPSSPSSHRNKSGRGKRKATDGERGFSDRFRSSESSNK